MRSQGVIEAIYHNLRRLEMEILDHRTVANLAQEIIDDLDNLGVHQMLRSYEQRGRLIQRLTNRISRGQHNQEALRRRANAYETINLTLAHKLANEIQGRNNSDH